MSLCLHARPRAVATAVATALMTGLLGAVAAAPANAAVPVAPVRLPVAIEGMPDYQPQTFCDPVDKPGPVKLGKLLTSVYRDTTVVDISRSCASEAGTSEHKDGRALDWGASYKNAQQVKEVQTVFSWLFAKDARGNADANLRRLGIMYIIWNKQIWGSWDQKWEPYACSGVTACHQDHVHFSFDWAGALAKTSFWTGTVAPPMSPPHYVYTSSAFPQIVSVSSRSTRVTTPFLVKPGLTYRFTVTGTYHPSSASGALADAECSTRTGTSWSALAPGDVSGSTGLLDLWVSGHRYWKPTPSTGGGCNTRTHTYIRDLTFPTTQALQFSVNDPTRSDDSGTFRVTVQRI